MVFQCGNQQYISFHVEKYILQEFLYVFKFVTNKVISMWCKFYLNFHEMLTHWSRVMHICVSRITNIGSDNGLSPGRRQAIIRTSAEILLIWTLWNIFQWNLHSNSHIFIQEDAFEHVVWKMAAILSRPQCVKSRSTCMSCVVNYILVRTSHGYTCLTWQ